MVGFEDLDTLKETLDHFKSVGKTHYDITGGEPSLCPKIEEAIKYASDIGLAGRMITSGLYLLNPDSRKLDAFLEAGLSDFLLSVHGLPEAHNKIVHAPKAISRKKSAFDCLVEVMEELSRRDFSFCINTVVTGHNTDGTHLLDLVRLLADRYPIRIWNFIHFNRYYGWTGESDRPVEDGIEVTCTDAVKAMIPAIDFLVERKIAVNVRYMPLCAFPEKYRRHIVGVRHYMYDPSEHDNQGETPDSFEARAEKLIRQRNKFGHNCFTCSVRPICDGVESGYLQAHGWGEFKPIRCGPSVVDSNHYRRGYEDALRLKELGEQG